MKRQQKTTRGREAENEEERVHSLRHLLVLRTDLLSSGEVVTVYISGADRQLIEGGGFTAGEGTSTTTQHNMSQPGQEDDEQLQRPEVREEELAEAKNKLGTSEKPKSKTLEVMEECEKMGKAAPSVFSGVKSGGETAFSKRSAKPIRK